MWNWIKSRTLPAGNQATGKWGEQAAAGYLEKHGYEILERRYRVSSEKGEIDLIARDPGDQDCLVFVEVKTRRSKNVRVAEAAVHWAKQRAMIRMGRAYMRMLRRPTGWRYDVVSVYVPAKAGDNPEIEHFRYAFREKG